jgi:hypothetical protein
MEAEHRCVRNQAASVAVWNCQRLTTPSGSIVHCLEMTTQDDPLQASTLERRIHKGSAGPQELAYYHHHQHINSTLKQHRKTQQKEALPSPPLTLPSSFDIIIHQHKSTYPSATQPIANMHFTPVIAFAVLLFSTTILAAPFPQLAGEGAALNSIFSSTDNGIGYGVEAAEDNTADLITSIKGGSTGSTTPADPGGPPPPPPHRRQLAGEGAALNSIFSSTDNGIGFAVKAAEDNTADNISKVKASLPKTPRQADKIANGLKDVGNAAGVSAVTNPVGDLGDSLDGTLTSAAANAGAQIGSTEESTLISTGKAIPKTRRQADKIANGLKNIGNAAGVSAVTNPVGDLGDSLDGALTGGVADAGAKIGSTEESTLISIGKAIPK